VIGRHLGNRFDVVKLSYQGISKVVLANLAKYLSLFWKQIDTLSAGNRAYIAEIRFKSTPEHGVCSYGVGHAPPIAPVM